MGCCYSSESDSSYHRKPSANVVSLSGELRQYPLPIIVSQVLQFEASSPDSVFLCNSDRLYFDDLIPVLGAEEELEPAQIYFVLPASRLQHRLAAADMAALAVKASVALNAATRRNRKARISPVLAVEEDPQSIHRVPINSHYINNKNAKKTSARSELGISSSSSVRRLHRYSSRRVKLAVRSFKIKLATINEGSILLN